MRSGDSERFGEVAQTFVNRPVPKTRDILEQALFITMLAVEIRCKHVCRVPDAAADLRIVEDINEGSRRIRNFHLVLSPPNGSGAEHFFRRNDFQMEAGA